MPTLMKRSGYFLPKAPIFVDVAEVDLDVHLPHIKDYWCKLLLGESAYQRHTMNIHRQLHGKRPLRAEDFQRWLAFFTATLEDNFQGERADRAGQVLYPPRSICSGGGM